MGRRARFNQQLELSAMRMDHWKPPRMRRFIFEYLVLHALWIIISLLRNANKRSVDNSIVNHYMETLQYVETFSISETTPERKTYRETVTFPPIHWQD
jgi:hypothetical protein